MSNDPVDSTVLSTLRDVMEGEYPELLKVFIKDSLQRVFDLHRILDEADFPPGLPEQWQQLGMLAHSFKGSSSNMGAAPLAELCRQLEELARGRAPNTAHAQVLVRAIDDEFQQVKGLFDIELQGTDTRH